MIEKILRFRIMCPSGQIAPESFESTMSEALDRFDDCCKSSLCELVLTQAVQRWGQKGKYAYIEIKRRKDLTVVDTDSRGPSP